MNKSHGLPVQAGDGHCCPPSATPWDTRGVAVGVNHSGDPLAQWPQHGTAMPAVHCAAVPQRPEDVPLRGAPTFVPVRPREDTPRPWLRQGSAPAAAPLSWRQKCEKRQPKRWAAPLIRLSLFWYRLDARGGLAAWLLGATLLAGCALGMLLLLG